MRKMKNNRGADRKIAFTWSAAQWAGMATLLGLLAALPIVIHGTNFYFGDNIQDLFLPIFIEIGRQVTHGFFPFVTLKEWFGGGIVGEYAFGVFNPVVIALSTVFYIYFNDFSYASAVFAVFHLVFYGLGVFAICGSLRCRFPESMFAAIVAATGIWLIYWAAMSWSCIIDS